MRQPPPHYNSQCAPRPSSAGLRRVGEARGILGLVVGSGGRTLGGGSSCGAVVRPWQGQGQGRGRDGARVEPPRAARLLPARHHAGVHPCDRWVPPRGAAGWDPEISPRGCSSGLSCSESTLGTDALLQEESKEVDIFLGKKKGLRWHFNIPSMARALFTECLGAKALDSTSLFCRSWPYSEIISSCYRQSAVKYKLPDSLSSNWWVLVTLKGT